VLYVCLSSDTNFQREVLASLLWHEGDAKKARVSLRQVVRIVKNIHPDMAKAIDIGRDKIRVDRTAISLDYKELSDQIRNDASGTPIQIDIDAILSNYTGLSSAFDAWIAITRNTIETTLRSNLVSVLENTSHDAKRRFFAAKSLINIDPTHEPAVQYVMQDYAQNGDQAAALKMYNALYYLLESEYDIEPSEETTNLVAAIKMGLLVVTPPPESTTVIHSPDLPEIYVADFDLMTQDPQSINLARVFRQELLANLSTFREWKLFDFEPEANKGYRMEATISERGDQIVVIATLKKNDDNRIIWSERFQVGFDNWSKTQWRFAQRLAEAVNRSITTDRLNRCLSNSLDSKDIFNKWVLSQALLDEWKPEKTDEALALLREVTLEAPRFAAAHSAIAGATNVMHIVYPGMRRNPQEQATSLSHAQKAMAIDPLDTNAHRVAAWCKALNSEYEVSAFHFERCCELNPNSALTRMSCALGFAFIGETARSLEIAEETREVVQNLPPFLWGYLQNIYFLAGDLEQAKHAGEMAGDAILNLPAWHAACLWELGHKQEAKRFGAKFLSGIRDNWCSQDGKSQPNIIDWLIHCFPIKKEAQKMRLKNGISSALSA